RTGPQHARMLRHAYLDPACADEAASARRRLGPLPSGMRSARVVRATRPPRPPRPATYLFSLTLTQRGWLEEDTFVYLRSVVGTSRCDVRAACSGATPSNAFAARIFVPPATTRAGTAQHAIPTIALNRYPASRRAEWP